MDLSLTPDKINANAPKAEKLGTFKEERTRLRNSADEVLNCSTDAALRRCKASTSGKNKKKLSFLERAKIRFKLFEAPTQNITYSKDNSKTNSNSEKQQKLNACNISLNNNKDNTSQRLVKLYKEKIAKLSKLERKMDRNSQRYKKIPVKENVKLNTSPSSSIFKIPESPPVKKKSQNKTTNPLLNNKEKSHSNVIDLKSNICDIVFQTGNGKKIQVSDRAIKRASKIFDDINLTLSDQPGDSNQLVNNENEMEDNLSGNSQEIQATKFNYNDFNDKSESSENSNDTLTDDVIESSQEDATQINRYKREKKNKNKSNVFSPNTKNSHFTQVSESQMCWVADNAESLMEATDSQWSSTQKSSLSSQNSQTGTERVEDEFEDLSTQENEFFENVTFSANNSQASGNSSLPDKSSEENKDKNMKFEFRGFTNEDMEKSFKISEIYRRTINYVKYDINRKKFFPIKFIFEDVRDNMQPVKKVNRYSLRSSQSVQSPSSSSGYKSRSRGRGTRKGKTLTPKRKVVQNLLKNASRKYAEDNDVKNKDSQNENNAFNKSFICDSQENFNETLITKEHFYKPTYPELNCPATISSEKDSNSKAVFNKDTKKRSQQLKMSKQINFLVEKTIVIPVTVTKTKGNDIDVQNTDTSTELSNQESFSQKVISKDPVQNDIDIFEDCELFEKEPFEEIDEVKGKGTEYSVHSYSTLDIKRKSAMDDNISTATKKRIKVCKEDRVLIGNDDLDIDNNTMKTSRKDDNFGFSTAAGTKIKFSEESLKKSKQLFADCEVNLEKFETSKTNENFGFTTAAGNTIKISDESLKKAKELFSDCNKLVSENVEELKKTADENFGFSTAGGRKIQTSEESLKRARNLFIDCDMNVEENVAKMKPTQNENFGFSTAGGKNIPVSEESLKRARNIFLDCDMNFEENAAYIKPAQNESFGFSTAGGKKIQVSEESLQKAKRVFADCEESIDKIHCSEDKENLGFSTAAGEKIKISEESLKRAKEVFTDCDELIQEKFEDTKIAKKLEISIESTKNINISEDSTSNSGKNVRESKNFCRKLEDTFHANVEKDSLNETCANIPGERKFPGTEFTSTSNTVEKKLVANEIVALNVSPINNKRTLSLPQVSDKAGPLLPNKLLKNCSSKKRFLGISPCRQINISETNLKKAKLILDDIDSPNTSRNLDNSFGRYTSTPIRCNEPNNSSRKLSFNTPRSRKSTDNELTLINDTSKTLQNTTTHFKDQSLVEELSDNFSRFSFRGSNINNADEKKANMLKEYELTKMKMHVIQTRLEMFEKQQNLLKNIPPENKRQIPGHLYKLKTKTKFRLSLKQAVNDERPGKLTFQTALIEGVPPSVLELTSENATKLNFFVPWWPNSNQTFPAVIQTADQTIIIPNESNNIGLTEIEPAFLTTPGIDAGLIPKGWIANHYRWIVWKLASMERSYHVKFTNCLSIENVISQLKYRYDREIDRAQRPALRKILEKDDVPGRRLVLCVAAILKLSNRRYELELTDGWYSIKATIDSPLNSLVEEKIIKPGLKLMLHGAELSNCEGCHPLETPGNVRLQIHYNSTRRAAWYVKLGYQKNPGPICISLRTINSNGGAVSCASAYIARVYPVSFMERLENTVVWRNNKAEQRNANEWESKQTELMERLQQQVQSELEREWTEGLKCQKKNLKFKDIKNITCSKTLYQLLNTSNDPYSVRDMMTPSQCYAVQEYEEKLVISRQETIASRLHEVSKSNIKKRDVCSVLKILLVDINSSYHSRFLSIWRPKDAHLQELKEGNVIKMFNVAVKNNGSLSSIPRTQFDLDLNADTIKFEYMERKVTPISQTLVANFKPMFHELDTVGMVVYMDIQELSQTLWLADENFCFLTIKVREGPETCLLDGIRVGQIVTVTNLIFQRATKLYGECLANHYTVFSSYPQQSYLQYFMNNFIDDFPIDIDKYLSECKDHVEVFLAQNAMRANTLNISMNSECQVKELKNRLCGVNPLLNDNSGALTLSDEELSTIDTQDYLLA